MNRAPSLASKFVWVVAAAILLAVAPEARAHFHYRLTTSFQDRAALQETMSALTDSHTDIDEMAMTANGEWVVIAGAQVFHSGGFPSATLDKIVEYVSLGLEIDAVAFTPSGSWVVVGEHLFWRSAGIAGGQELHDILNTFIDEGRRISELVFDADGNGWSVVAGTAALTRNMPTDFFAAVVERNAGRRTIRAMSMGFDGRWVVLADQWFASDRLSPQLYDRLRQMQRDEIRHDRVVLGLGDDYLVAANGVVEPDPDDPMSKIEYGLGADGKNIWTRMDELRIPGVSLAVIDDNQVVYARGYGTLEAGTQRWVRASSPFAVGSISKLAASVGMMRLVDDDALSLNATLAQFRGEVRQWYHFGRIFPSLFGTGDAFPLDIRLWQLLSHMGNFNHNSIEFHPMYRPNDESTLWTLLGYYCNAAGCGFNRGKETWYDVSIGTGVHGETFSYSNKGYLVAQAVMETVEGESFERIMLDRVLTPLGMRDSSYSALLGPTFQARSSTWHNTQGQPIPHFFIPNGAAGGLYATPSDYALILTMLMDDGVAADGTRFLSPGSVDQIFTDRTPAGDGRLYGFGVELKTDGNFTHGGAVRGGSSCFEGNRAARQAIVMATNVPYMPTNEVKPGRELMREIRLAFRSAYGWPPGENRLSC